LWDGGGGDEALYFTLKAHIVFLPSVYGQSTVRSKPTKALAKRRRFAVINRRNAKPHRLAILDRPSLTMAWILSHMGYGPKMTVSIGLQSLTPRNAKSRVQ